ncbi:MAG: FtsX-like permease family protein [Cytophagales bacterium]
MYEDQERFGKLVGYFGFLAILISCLGSYALIMFIASQKRKEVGIRKVLGANSIDIILLLSRNFIYLTMASIIISIPISIYLSDYWLNDFANRITLSPVHIFIAAMSTLILIALTVGIHSYRSSRENPINALRME